MNSDRNQCKSIANLISRHILALCGIAFLSLITLGQPRTIVRSRTPAAKSTTSTGFVPGTINIFAGNGTNNGTFANGSLPTNVALDGPVAVASDSSGNVYIAAGTGFTIYVVYAGGSVPPILAAVTTQAATPVTPVAGDIYQITGVSSNCGYCYQDGLPASQLFLNGISALWFDSSDNLYITDNLNGYVIIEIPYATGVTQVVAGQFNNQSDYSVGNTIQAVPANSIQLFEPTDAKTDSFGNLYLTDNGNTVVLVVYSGSQPPPVLSAEGVSTTTADLGNIYTIAGQIQNSCFGPGTCTDNGPAYNSIIAAAQSVSVDAAGNVYILDNFANTVRLIYVGGKVPPLLGGVKNPQAGNIYTIAGINNQFNNCTTAPCGDGGSAANMSMNNPLYMAVDSAGDLYIADTSDFAIRKIDAAGTVSTIAGIDDPNQTTPVLPTGGGIATSTALNQALNVAFDPEDNLYIADGGYSVNSLGYDVVWEVDNGTTEAKPQTITFPPLSAVQYGAGQVALDAAASSGLPVEYTATGPGFVSGSGSSSVLNVTAAGTVSVTASQAGDPEWSPAAPVTQTLIVNKATLTVAAPANASKQAGQPNPPFVATYSGFIDQDTLSSSVTGRPVFTTTATASSPAGTYPITVSQGSLASTNYVFTFVDGTLTVTGTTSQTISFGALPPITYGQVTALSLSASASSGLPVEYTVVSGPATVSGSTLSITGGGTIVIMATQAGNSTFAGAAPVTQSLVVKPAPLTVTAPSLSFPIGSTITPSTFPAPSISGFIGSDSASLVTGSATYATTASSTSPVGQYPITIARGTLALVPEAASNYTFATFLQGTLSVTPPGQTISYTPLPAVAYGLLFQVTASASSNLPVTFAVSGPLAIQGSNVTIPGVLNYVYILATGVGPATITLTQAGDANYAAAPAVTVPITIGPAELDVQANNLTIEQGAQLPMFTYQIGQNVPGFIDIPSIVSGIPLLTTAETQSSPPGTYPIVVSVGTLTSQYYYFNFINGTLTVTPPGSFTITASPSTVTIPAGMSAQTTVTLTASNSYQGTVTLSCGQTPANVTCTVSPASYTFPGSQNPDGSENAAQGTVTINTTTNTIAGATSSVRTQARLATMLIPGALSGLILLFMRRRAAKTTAIWTWALFAVLGLSLNVLSSCSGAGHPANNTASSGTSTIMINGSGTTPSGTSFVTASTPLTVVIQ